MLGVWTFSSPQHLHLAGAERGLWTDSSSIGNRTIERTVNVLSALYARTKSKPHWGSGDISVVRAPDSWLKGRGFESLQEQWENFLLQGQLSVRTLILVSVRTLRRTMIRFLIEHLVRRIWFGQSRHYFILNWLVMRCKLRPELAADAQQTA